MNEWSMNYVKNRMTNEKPQLIETRRQAAFTLIELLVVITIIGLLVALTIPVLSGIRRREVISKAQSEMAWLSTAIDSYKAVYGYYPPSNPNNVMISPLFYELLGVTNQVVGGKSYYTPLDGNTDANIPSTDPSYVHNGFGIDGFMNLSKGSGEEEVLARTFLTGLKNNQYYAITNNGVQVYILVSSQGGPNSAYQPIGPGAFANPWRYNSVNPTNNPQSYDLWMDLAIGPTNKLTRVANWTKQVITFTP